jgi:tetratricopeptide (TPR) repeat protein
MRRALPLPLARLACAALLGFGAFGGNAAAQSSGLAAPRAGADAIAADARAAYTKALRGELADAEALYASVIARGHPTADLLTNLGTVQLERGELVEAVVSFERALRLDPAHDDARINLAAAKARLGAEPTDEAPSVRDVLPALAAVGWTGWALLAIAGNALLALGVAWRRGRWTAASVGAVLLTVAALAMGTWTWGARRAEAVVLETVELRGGPAPRYADVGQLPAGATVRVQTRRDRWVEVRAPDGRRGWVEIDRLRSL